MTRAEWQGEAGWYAHHLKIAFWLVWDWCWLLWDLHYWHR